MIRTFIPAISGAIIAGLVLPAAGLSAEALAPFDITLKGDAFFTTGYVRQNTDADARRLDFMNEFQLKTTATAVADNGLTYGARIRVRTVHSSGDADTDQAYLFARGRFGSMELGLTRSPNYLHYVTAPHDFGTGGVDGDWTIGDTGWLQNQNTFLEAYFGGGFTPVTYVNGATRIVYYSPRLFGSGGPDDGVQVMAAYAPVNRSVNSSVKRIAALALPGGPAPYGFGSTTAFSNCGGGADPLGCNLVAVREIDARYDGKIGSVSLSASAGYLGADTPDLMVTGIRQRFYNLAAWQFGAQASYRGIQVGGGYLTAGRSAYPRASALTGPLDLRDQDTWTAGLSYDTGPWSVGVNYQHGHDAGDLTAPGARTADLYAAGVTLTLAPGLTTALEYLRSTTRNETGYVSDSYGDTAKASGNAHLVLWKTRVVF